MAAQKNPTRMDRVMLPMEITHISRNALVEQCRFKDNVAEVTFNGRTYIHKTHVSASADLLFPAELKVYTLYKVRSPHVIDFVGYTTDEDDKIDGMLLEFCPNYDLRGYLRTFGPCDWSLKMKWAVQIAHGLMKIHEVGLTHGDLRAENIVLDDNLDCKIIDIVQGWGFMFGWNPWRFPETENIYKPHWDIYSLGVTLWEIATDGQTPAENQTPEFDASILDNITGLRMATIARKCLSDKPEIRPTAETVLNELGGLDICGCNNEERERGCRVSNEGR